MEGVCRDGGRGVYGMVEGGVYGMVEGGVGMVKGVCSGWWKGCRDGERGV